MPIVFHKLGHSDGERAGASVNLFLTEGLKSKALLRKEGKLEQVETPYEFGLRRRADWIKERSIALADNPQLLRATLASDKESTWLGGDNGFYKPNFQGNREENIFFGCLNNPPHNADWVAIDANENEAVHNASFRDEGDPLRWQSTSVKLGDFIKMAQKPPSWRDNYNELLRRDRVKPEEIIAYAKTEKVLPLDHKLTDDEKDQIRGALGKQLSPYLQFENEERNILLHDNEGKLEIRVAFNKEKTSSKNARKHIRGIFSKINSLKDIKNPSQPLNHRPVSRSFFLGNRGWNL